MDRVCLLFDMNASYRLFEEAGVLVDFHSLVANMRADGKVVCVVCIANNNNLPSEDTGKIPPMNYDVLLQFITKSLGDELHVYETTDRDNVNSMDGGNSVTITALTIQYALNGWHVYMFDPCTKYNVLRTNPNIQVINLTVVASKRVYPNADLDLGQFLTQYKALAKTIPTNYGMFNSIRDVYKGHAEDFVESEDTKRPKIRQLDGGDYGDTSPRTVRDAGGYAG